MISDVPTDTSEPRAGDLFEAHRHVAEACRDHRFLTGIADGSLDRAAFVSALDAVFQAGGWR